MSSLRAAARALLRAPAATGAAALSLGLAIAGTTVVFTIADALLLRPLPARAGGSLVRIGATSGGEGFLPFSYPEVEELRADVSELSGVLGHHPNQAIVRVGEDARTEMIELVTADYFEVLGILPSPGRGFVAAEERPGGGAVVVVSADFWRTLLAGDPAVVGRTIHVNGHPFTVAGVAPPGFRGTFAGFAIALWAPVGAQAQALPSSGTLANREDRFLMLVGRLAPGASRAALRNRLRQLSERWQAAHPDEGRGRGFAVADASGTHPLIAGLVRGFVVLLGAVMALVLAVACANVAALSLARGSARRKERAVRAALGASRWRIAAPLLLESLLLALLAAAVGLIVAAWGGALLSGFRPSAAVPVALDLGVGVRALAFTTAVAALTALVFGVAPALDAGRTDPLTVLRSGADAKRPMRARRVLVVAQVMVSTLLLMGAALLVRSSAAARSVDPGFDPRNVLVLHAAPELLGYDEPAGRRLWENLLERARAIPGVRESSVALMVPMGERADFLEVASGERGFPEPPAGPPRVGYNIVRSGFLPFLGIPLVRGRDFRADEADDVVILNETLARRLFGAAEPIGGEVLVRERDGNVRHTRVVGIAHDVAVRLAGEDPRPFLYLPLTGWYRSDMVLHVRVGQDPGGVAAALLREVRALDPDLPARVYPMERELEFALVPARVARTALGFAGGLTLVLATTGLFGLISYSVSRRTREIALRVALGADRQAIRRLVLKEAFVLAGAGVALGVAAGLMLARMLGALLLGIPPHDPFALVATVVALAAVAGLATLAPMRRATAVEPAAALRADWLNPGA